MENAAVIILFAAGLILIIKGGDWFVDAAIWLAEITGIPRFIIGATVMSLATTLPEVLVSSIAACQGHPGMALGNAIGSVTCNTGVIMAISIIFINGAVSRKKLTTKGLLLILAGALTWLFSKDLVLSVTESLVIFAIYLLSIADSIVSGKKDENRSPMTAPARKDIVKNICSFAAGAAAMAVGARLMVDNGEIIAKLLGVPDILISITLVAIGTSLPELVTTLTAIAKNQSDMSIGNIVGANLLDICLVVPVSAFLSAGTTGAVLEVDPTYVLLHIPAALLISAIAIIPTVIRQKTTKSQGLILLICYMAYLAISISA